MQHASEKWKSRITVNPIWSTYLSFTLVALCPSVTPERAATTATGSFPFFPMRSWTSEKCSRSSVWWCIFVHPLAHRVKDRDQVIWNRYEPSFTYAHCLTAVGFRFQSSDGIVFLSFVAHRNAHGIVAWEEVQFYNTITPRYTTFHSILMGILSILHFFAPNFCFV